MSLTKNPIKPIMQKPIAVAIAIFWNSVYKTRIITQIAKIENDLTPRGRPTFPVGFGASFHQPDRVFGELPSGFQHFGDLIHILSRRSGPVKSQTTGVSRRPSRVKI